MKTFFTIRHFAGKNTIHFVFADSQSEAFGKFKGNYLFENWLTLDDVAELEEDKTFILRM